MAPIISFATQAVARFAAAPGLQGHLVCKLPTQVLSQSSVARPSAAISVSKGILPWSLKIHRNLSNSAASESQKTKPQADTPQKVYFDICICKEHVGKIVIGLYGNVVPDTAKKFLGLCTGEFDYTYKGSRFLEVVKGMWIKGGYFETNNGVPWRSKEPTFKDETIKLKHNGPGVVSMDCKGKQPNTGQFIISTRKNDAWDDQKVVIGHVLEGMDVIKKIESLDVVNNIDFLPKKKVVISACGRWP